MGAATPVLPNFETMSGDPTAYKEAIEGSLGAAWRQAMIFAPHEQATPDMTIRVEPGPEPSYNADTDTLALTEKAAQNTATIVAPTTHPRIDRVVIGRLDGVVSVVAGTEAASPSAPAIPAGKLPICRVTLQTTTTAITNNMIDDERKLSLMGVTFPTPPDPPTPATTLKETKSFTNALAVSFNNLDPSKRYQLVIEAVPSNNNCLPFINFNADVGNNYSYSANQSANGSNSATHGENVGSLYMTGGSFCVGATHCIIIIDFMAWSSNSHNVDINFRITASNGVGSNEMLQITGAGRYVGSGDMASITIYAGNGTLTGKAYLYEIVLS